jgi:hypothetical protein
MSPAAQSARELAHRLIARAAAESGAPNSAVLPVQAACEQVQREITRWLGAVGSHELMTRAVAQARAEHPLLDQIGIGGPSEPLLDGVTAVVRTSGERAAAEALGALLETLLSLLGRLVGDDLTARLADGSQPGPRQDEDTK